MDNFFLHFAWIYQIFIFWFLQNRAKVVRFFLFVNIDFLLSFYHNARARVPLLLVLPYVE